jgi:hypothetical protein
MQTAPASTVHASIPHWTDGARGEETSGRSGPVTDPATGGRSRKVAFASLGDDDAVAAAAAGVDRHSVRHPLGQVAIISRSTSRDGVDLVLPRGARHRHHRRPEVE